MQMAEPKPIPNPRHQMEALSSIDWAVPARPRVQVLARLVRLVGLVCLIILGSLEP